VNWVGGITEARRIVAMAAAYDLPVIPHGSSVFSYHLQVRILPHYSFHHIKKKLAMFFSISQTIQLFRNDSMHSAIVQWLVRTNQLKPHFVKQQFQ
jgi:L-alanine-DL-glutamate epimerase-like enolase superfamily enzyme